MAEVSTEVYDIMFPSPPALKDIAAIEIAVQLRCQEIAALIKNTSDKIIFCREIPSGYSVSHLPSTILRLIEKYIAKVGSSINFWLQYHSRRCLFNQNRHYSFKKEILYNFTDFAADFDGSIHYARTAKRIVLCDRIDEILRFMIACLYCFEDEILRIWPAVSSRVNLKNTSFSTNPLLCYWICRLKKQLYKLPRSAIDGQSIEEQILCIDCLHPWSAFEYLWNRLEGDNQSQIKINPPASFNKYYRYLLPKFNEQELEEFANTVGYQMISSSVLIEVDHDIDRSCIPYEVQDETYIMAFWQYTKNYINRDLFSHLVRNMIQELSFSSDMLYTSPSTCCKLWNSAPNHLKSHIIEELLHENSLFEHRHKNVDVSFLSIVLSDASAEDKNAFWNEYWHRMINALSIRQFDQVMRVCFNNDKNKIAHFKLNSLSVLENIREKCSTLLNNLHIEELNKFLRFCCPDELRCRSLRRDLILEEFIVDKMTIENIINVSCALDDFIHDTYDDVNFAIDVKTQFLFLPSTIAKFREIIDSSLYCGSFYQVVRFIDSFAPSEHVAMDFKRLHILPMFAEMLYDGDFMPKFEDNEFANFLHGCLRNDDEVAEFKNTLSVDEIVLNAIRNGLNRLNGLQYNSGLVQFLEWYFVTPQAFEEYKSRYSDDDEFAALTSRE